MSEWLRKLVEFFGPVRFCPCGLQEAEAKTIPFCSRCGGMRRQGSGA
jgi:hypothetical protein